MKWVKDNNYAESMFVPIKSWCEDIEAEALRQAVNLASHPTVRAHVALMPDCHVGYGMPIGGVIGCENAVIPNAVGVDIGCGMAAVQTSAKACELADMRQIRTILELLKEHVPAGEGNSHKTQQQWEGFDHFFDSVAAIPVWAGEIDVNRDRKNLGTLGGGNHFIELQGSEDGDLWLMLHSGSRNLGHRIATHYHKLAQALNAKWHTKLPHADLAFLPVDSDEGQAYIRDMNFALDYAYENRQRMMAQFKAAVQSTLPGVQFVQQVNIHHNYAALENHFGRNLWVHRKGATSAKVGELGIIPGSMGTASYIVRGLGNADSLMSCSHGAGRKMGRSQASHTLTIEECDQAMQGIVFDRWKKARKRKGSDNQEVHDLSEAPQAYKDIDAVIEAELDLIEPLVKLRPLGVVKG